MHRPPNHLPVPQPSWIVGALGEDDGEGSVPGRQLTLLAPSFLSLLFSDANWRRSNATLLRELANETRPPEVPVQPCALPSRRTAEELFRK